MKKVVIASDSFKGSLSSLEVALAVEAGVKEVFPECDVTKVPVADGGEGTVEAIMAGLGGSWRLCRASDPLGRPMQARYALCGDVAVVEVAAASGLTLLSPEERNPWKTSSFGTGMILRDAFSSGCTRVIIGLGGSATNDGGAGLLAALGARFLDSASREVEPCGGNLADIADIDVSAMMPQARKAQWTVICDVDSPLCGPRGAAYTFAPQKGADAEMVRALDAGLSSFAAVMRRCLGVDVADAPGAGAAGGIGGGLMAFFGANLRPGIDVVLDTIGFDGLIEGADLVVTGEGRMDWQTACGKTPAGILLRAKRQGIPVAALAGKVEMCDELRAMGFSHIIEVSDRSMPLSEAMRPEITSRRLREAVSKLLES